MWITKYTSPGMYLNIREQDTMLKQCVEVAEQRKGVGNEENGHKEATVGRPSMIEAFTGSSLPESERHPERLRGEMAGAIAAGTLTSSGALKCATYHILANPAVHEKSMILLENEIPDLTYHLLSKTSDGQSGISLAPLSLVRLKCLVASNASRSSLFFNISQPCLGIVSRAQRRPPYEERSDEPCSNLKTFDVSWISGQRLTWQIEWLPRYLLVLSGSLTSGYSYKI